MLVTINERLSILKEGNVISHEAALLAEKAVQRLTSRANDLSQNKLDMLVTHLATALTRMSRGEAVDHPPELLLAEVDNSEHVPLALKEIRWIESVWESNLPESEIAFLKIHYVSIFQEMKGEKSL